MLKLLVLYKFSGTRIGDIFWGGWLIAGVYTSIHNTLTILFMIYFYYCIRHTATYSLFSCKLALPWKIFSWSQGMIATLADFSP